MISNSIKNAFGNSQKGIIFVGSQQKGSKIILTVGDNGIVINEEINFGNIQTLGLQLACSLVEQIEGKILLENAEGTKFIITFKH